MSVKNWASILDENTRLQAEMLSRSPVIFGHVALMPDAHLGLGATVGSVIATSDAVIPAAVGVDIGCGMIAVETSLTAPDLPNSLQPLHQRWTGLSGLVLDPGVSGAALPGRPISGCRRIRPRIGLRETCCEEP